MEKSFVFDHTVSSYSDPSHSQCFISYFLEQLSCGMVVSYAGVGFKTYSGLPFSYEIKKGRNGEYTKELWIDRRENSKSLAWSSIVLALKNIKGEVVDRPKALGDIRGVTYIYGMFYRFGLIDVPDKVKEKMGRPKDRKK